MNETQSTPEDAQNWHAPQQSSPGPYQPTSEDYAKAENTMAEEQRKATKIRENVANRNGLTPEQVEEVVNNLQYEWGTTDEGKPNSDIITIKGTLNGHALELHRNNDRSYDGSTIDDKSLKKEDAKKLLDKYYGVLADYRDHLEPATTDAKYDLETTSALNDLPGYEKSE